jgi:DNA (cytosine-5)-methyltransferase 1
VILEQNNTASTPKLPSMRAHTTPNYAIARSLRADGFDASEDGTGRGTPLVVADTVRSHPRPGSNTVGAIVLAHGQANAEMVRDGSPSLTCNHEAPIVIPIQEYQKRQSGTPENGSGIGKPADPMFTLQATAQHAIAFQTRIARNGHGVPSDVAPSLQANATGDSKPVIAFHQNQRAEVTTNDTAGSLNSGGGKPGQGYPAAMTHSGIRRLTPRECERLQGFPDDFTLIQYKGKPAADGPRYKSLGNSMAVPVIRWIGQRIKLVDSL